MRHLTCASFFADVSGIDIGFEETGHFHAIYANELDPYPVTTYELNSKLKVDNRSITDIKANDLPNFDVMLAGFPCTDISVAGYRKGLFNDDGSLTRSGLFFELIRIIHEKKPQIVFLENVKHLLTHNCGETMNIVLTALAKEGYSFKFQVMDAAIYGNTPQHRERIYIVCSLDEQVMKNFTFPEAIPLTKKISDIIDFQHPVEEKYYYTKGKYTGNIYEKLVEGMDGPDAVYQWRRHYLRKNKMGVVPTLTDNMGGGGHNVPLVKTPFGIRKLTPKECFNAQGFPESFLLPEYLSDTRLYKQAGNSVCVDVIRRIAENIYDAISVS